MTFARLALDRSSTALRSARLLLDTGDTIGAASRTYYASFDAARAALSAVLGETAVDGIKTHGGLWSRFSAEIVKTGRVDLASAKAMASVEDLRLFADYGRTPPPPRAVSEAIDAVSVFLEACRAVVDEQEAP